MPRRRRSAETDTSNAGTATAVADDDEDDLLNTKGGGGIPEAASGWDAFKNKRDEARSGGDFISGKDDMWKPDDEETLIKFLDDEPFAVYYDVWVPAKNRSFSTENPENPLTEKMSLRPQLRVLFNVIVFNIPEDEDEPVEQNIKVLRAGVKLAELLEDQASSKRGPLSKHYWEMKATGTKKNYTPIMNVMKAAELEDDWGVKPLSNDELEAFELFTKDMVYLYDDEGLRDVVKDLTKGM